MNVFTAIGRLGRDAETRYTADGKPITTFAVAVDDGFGDRKVTSWIDCAMFGERGPKIAEFIRKGDRIGVTGSIRLDTYKTRDGLEKSKIAMRVQDVTLLSAKQDSGNGTPRSNAPATTQRAPRATDEPRGEFVEDDIPFISGRDRF